MRRNGRAGVTVRSVKGPACGDAEMVLYTGRDPLSDRENLLKDSEKNRKEPENEQTK